MGCAKTGFSFIRIGPRTDCILSFTADLVWKRYPWTNAMVGRNITLLCVKHRCSGMYGTHLWWPSSPNQVYSQVLFRKKERSKRKNLNTSSFTTKHLNARGLKLYLSYSPPPHHTHTPFTTTTTQLSYFAVSAQYCIQPYIFLTHFSFSFTHSHRAFTTGICGLHLTICTSSGRFVVAPKSIFVFSLSLSVSLTQTQTYHNNSMLTRIIIMWMEWDATSKH